MGFQGESKLIFAQQIARVAGDQACHRRMGTHDGHGAAPLLGGELPPWRGGRVAQRTQHFLRFEAALAGRAPNRNVHRHRPERRLGSAEQCRQHLEVVGRRVAVARLAKEL